jgi:hypothetical protein
MKEGEALEAELQKGWSFDELEVYADLLLANNDPRGDVVAIDLSPRPEQATWVQRRRGALAAWIGSSLAHRAGHLIQHGFIHALRDGMYPTELLDSPAGKYIRDYTTWGYRRVPAALEKLASKPRPWLTRLTIAYYRHPMARLPDALVRKLIAATPRLEEVCIYGDAPFDAFPHPNVKRARLGTRCYGIEIDADKTRVDVPDQCPSPRIAQDDLELLMDLVELAPDCNQLYTYGQEFAEPLPALIARLAAAKLVELDGPVVRIAGSTLEAYPGQRDTGLDDLPNRWGTIRSERGHEVSISYQQHCGLIRSCLETLPVAARTEDVLLAYRALWDRMTGAVALGADRVRQLREALDALFELRAMWSVELGTMDLWIQIEELVALLDCDDVRLYRPYYWYG